MRSRAAAALSSLLVLAATTILVAQARPPRPEVTAVPIAAPVAAGTAVKASLRVKLPEDVHVQSDKPRDPLLIATELTFKLPAGFSVDRIVYPKAKDLAQPGRTESLAVFSGTFTIDAFLKVAADTPAGETTVPAQLRYQACDATVCFAPARAELSWAIRVARP